MPPSTPTKPLSQKALCFLVTALASEFTRVQRELSELRTHNHGLQEVKRLRLSGGKLCGSAG